MRVLVVAISLVAAALASLALSPSLPASPSSTLPAAGEGADAARYLLERGEQHEEQEEFDAPLPLDIPEEARLRKNPVAPRHDSVVRGEWLFTSHCAVCHGACGEGRGELAEALGLLMPDFADPERQAAWTDGEVFYVIGMGRERMPPHRDDFPEAFRWDLVNFIRTLDDDAAAPPEGQSGAGDDGNAGRPRGKSSTEDGVGGPPADRRHPRGRETRFFSSPYRVAGPARRPVAPRLPYCAIAGPGVRSGRADIGPSRRREGAEGPAERGGGHE